MRNIFLEKSYTKCGRKIILRSFSKKSSIGWAYLWVNILKFYIFCFNCLPSWGLLKVIETKLLITCFYLIKSLFKKQKEVWKKFPFLIFCMIFEEKYFCCYSITWPNFNAWFPLICEILGNVYCNCLTRLWHQKIWN